MENYTPMIRQYLEIKADYPDAFLFFRLGDFYELFFEDAIKASKELEITLTGRDGGGEERIPMCGVPHHSAENYIRTLIQKGYKVAICEQVEDPKTAKGVVKREVTRVITPGTVMDGSMLTSDNNYLGVIYKENETSYGLAFCDLTTGEFYSPRESLDSWLAAIEEIITYSPKEVLVDPAISEKEIKQLKGYISCSLTILDNAQLHEGEDLALQWFPTQAKQLANASLQASGAIISYLLATQKRSMEHVKELQIYEANRYLILDPFTRRNLELVETIRSKSKYGSLLWLMDRTVTPMGGRLLKRWMDKPLLSAVHILERQDGVEYFVQHPIIRTEIRTLLQQVYDLERLAARVAYGNINGRDMVQIRRSLQIIPQIVAPFFGNNDAKLPGIMRFIYQLDSCQDIVNVLEAAIVDDPPASIKEGGIIKDGYSSRLDELRDASRNGKQWIANLEQKEREATGIRSLKIGYNKVFGYYLEVTKANLSALPGGRYERKQTLSNAERFVTPELKETESLILEAEERMVELEYQLFHEIREALFAQISRLQSLARNIATLDVLSALAEVAQTYHYVRPSLNSEGNLHILEGRHPVIEAVMQRERFIPNSTHLDHDQRIYLITGPNMAGKSTYMRQVAIIVLMFQMGAFVPAEKADLPIVDRIFTRIGAADDLVEGQSTFMVEMNEIKITTTQATANSLVIIDELGRGTSTQDGMAIAQAVIEHLHDTIGCKTLVSTHFHELASLENVLPSLKNYHMAVKETEDNVIFTRQLIPGAASKSYGIYCAHLAGIPQSIISRANTLITEVKVEASHQLELFIQEDRTEAKNAHKKMNRNTENSKMNPKETEVIEALQRADLINFTPLQALNFLFELKKKL